MNEPAANWSQVSRSRIQIEGNRKLAADAARARLLICMAAFAAIFFVLSARVVDLSLFQDATGVRSAGDRGLAVGPRPEIIDRNGMVLATNLDTVSVYANPRELLDPNDTAEKLARIFPELNLARLKSELTPKRSFVWIKRKATPREQALVNDLGMPGLVFEHESQRIYPQGALAAHVVGFVDVDNKGLAGIEREIDLKHPSLAGLTGPVQLSLDLRVQQAMRDELSRAVEKFQARGGGGLVMDVKTGEVLAMVSLPDFDPNNPTGAPSDARFNRMTLGVYEMGSTFKSFNTAAVLDYGVGNLNSSYDATNPIHIARFTIKDDHAQRRWLTIPEVFIHSSNIGSAKMAVEMGAERQQAFLRKVGLFEKSQIELPEVGTPQIPQNWGEIATMTVAFGHGISVSPVNLAAGIAAMTNGGTFHQATILKRDGMTPPPGETVISSRTSDMMRMLFRMVVEQGTGRQANADGYRVGGKTGTAEKVGAMGGYQRHALLSSFVGIFPIDNPRYVVMAMIDEPHGDKDTYGYATGGWVAAPVVRNVVMRMAPILGVAPADMLSPEVQRGMFQPVGLKVSYDETGGKPIGYRPISGHDDDKDLATQISGERD